jgi:hypothetical protein
MFLLIWPNAMFPQLCLHPSLQPFQLSILYPRDQKLEAPWSPLISPDAVSAVRSRYRGLQPQQK